MKKNLRIAIICAPIAAVLNPILPIVSVLMRRGHDVAVASSDPFASRIEALDVKVIRYRYGVLIGPKDEYAYCRLAINTLAAVTPFYEKDRPDLIIYDIVSFAGPILAHKWQVPRIRISPLCAFSRETLSRQLTPQRCARALEANVQIDQFLRQHDVPSHDFLFHREKLNIHTMPRDFDPCADLTDDSCLYAGRCGGEQFAFGQWSPPRGDRTIVLVACSRSWVQGPDYFKLCITALSGLPWHVVLSIGDDGSAEDLQPLPENFEVVLKTSHTRILPHASLMIFMGGSATSNEAAYHGVPLVMTSLGVHELEEWSDNLVRLGLGVHIKGKDVSAPLLRQAAIDVHESERILHNVKQLQRKVLWEPGAEETANRIEDSIRG
jgi:MGT family glycosyltransferase